MKTKSILMGISFSLLAVSMNAQAWLQTGNVVGLGSFLGSTNNLPSNFKTNNTQRMTILSTNGFVGIGTNFTSPLNLLDIRNGSVNVGLGIGGNIGASPQGYKIGGNFVVRHNANVNDIFLGVNAGNGFMTGHFNTFTGNFSGFANSSGVGNTATGFGALTSNTISGGNTAMGFESLINSNDLNVPLRDGNTALGFQTLKFSTNGFRNTAVGYQALLNSPSGTQLVAVGYRVLANTLGNNSTGLGEENTAVGNEAMEFNTLGRKNVAFGDDVMLNNSTGSHNTAAGSEVMGLNTIGSSNTSIGHRSMQHNITGRRNTVLGDSAGTNNQFGNANTFGGYQAGMGLGLNSHNDNSFFGYQSGINITNGSANTFIGFLSGTNNNSGNRNTIIGQQANSGGINSAVLANASAIGSEAIVTANAKMILGNDTVDVGIGLSNDVTQFGPQNKLEIDAGINGHNPSNGGVGASGLRFRDLHALNGTFAANTPVPNSFSPPAVLSVNQFGDVVLVPDQGGAGSANADNGCSLNGPTIGFVHLGNDLIVNGGSGGKLLDHREIPMNHASILFSDPSSPSTTQPLARNSFSFGRFNTVQTIANPKLYCHTDTLPTSGMFVTDASTYPAGIFQANAVKNPGGFTFNPVGPTGLIGYVYGGNFGAGGLEQKSGVVGIGDALSNTISSPTGLNVYGVYGQAIGNTTSNVIATGVFGSAPFTNISTNTGGYFNANNSSASNNGVIGEAAGSAHINTGVVGSAFGAVINYGMYANSIGPVGTNYGIYASGTGGATNSFGVFGSSQPPLVNSWAGYFQGNVQINGTTSGAIYNFTSDSNLKTGIAPISNPLTLIRELKPKSFYFDTNNTAGFYFPSKKQYGFLAQDVNSLAPELVYSSVKPADSLHAMYNYASLNYNAFIGILTAGMQQQQATLDSLRTASIFGPCASQPALTSSIGVNLNGNNIIFGSKAGSIGINTSCTPAAKLDVLQNSTISNSIGIQSINNDPDGVALKAISNGSASGSFTQVAAFLQATSISGKPQVAMFVPKGGGNVNIGFGAPSNSNSGMVNVAGSIYSGGSPVLTSDSTLKTNIQTLPNSLSQVLALRPVTFQWDSAQDALMTGTHAGFTAQQMNNVIPQLVHTTNGVMSIAYTELIPYLVSAMQALTKQVDSMKNVMITCCQNTGNQNSRTMNQQTVQLTDATSITLNDAVPNPFAEQTTISYNVPETYSTAQLLFYDANGRNIKSLALKLGSGQVTVFADDLTNGIYSYTLVVDGKIIDTKRMVKQN